MFEQGEFLSRQFNIFAAAGNAHIVKIDRHLIVFVTRARISFASAKNGTDACNDLLYRERFDDVIVGSGFESGDLVAFGGLSRQHYYWHLFNDGFAADASAHFDAAHTRKH